MRKMTGFCAVGVLATTVHVVVAAMLITKAGRPAALANAAAFCMATGVSYGLNSWLTFARPFSRRTLLRFGTVALAGLGLSTLISGTAQWFGMHYLIGIAAVVLSVPPLTFLAHRDWTYRS
jgi:putative flippase GtrA